MGNKYYVKVIRAAIEAAVIEVEADDHASALANAVELAETSNATWTNITDDDDYTVHPLSVRDEEDVELVGLEDLLCYEHHKFMVLFADTSSGEGSVLPEPWMGEETSLLVSDVTGDWVEGLEELKEDASGAYYEHLAEIQAEATSPAGGA